MKRYVLVIILLLSLSCSLPSIANTIKNSPTSTFTFSPLPSTTFAMSSSPSTTITILPSATAPLENSDTPTPEATKTFTQTPTDAPFTASGLMNANCRLGPNKAYIPSGVALKEGGKVFVEGWNATNDGKWYWVQLENVTWHCWVHDSTVELAFDPSSLPYVAPIVPTNASVPTANNVKATRSSNNVTITWNPAPSAPELGYLIEAGLCYDGYMVNAAFDTLNTSYTLRDDTNCSSKSFGTLRVKNKLGYSNPVTISWP